MRTIFARKLLRLHAAKIGAVNVIIYAVYYIISQLWLIFSIAASKPLIIGADYDCELFPCTEKYHLKPVLLNYAVLPIVKLIA